MGKVPNIKPTRANRPRNAFDLSQRHLFTASPGMLLPIMSLDLIPHDHVEINATDFMRTMPMNTAAFMSMRGVYEFFFVPYSHLFHQFDQFITGMRDFRSSNTAALYQDTCVDTIPYFNLASLYNRVKNGSIVGVDMFGFRNSNSIVRLLDLLGYGRPVTTSGIKRGFLNSVDNMSYNVSIFKPAAYQKIYQDYYRNDAYEPYDVFSYSLDHYVGLIGDSYVDRYFLIRYRNAARDAYSNLRPSPLFDWSLEDQGATLIDVFKPKVDAGHVDFSYSLGSTDNTSVFMNTNDVLSIADLRKAFALEKMFQITARAGKTYAEQIKAHFGFEVSEGRDGRCHYLGGFDSDFEVGDVTQSSGTTVTGDDVEFGGYLGRVTGKAIGKGNGRITYDAKEHGVLMCIYSVVPAMQYDSTRIEPFNLKVKRGDFFIPEFENLGMQPSFIVNYSDSVYNDTHASLSSNDRLRRLSLSSGWQLRYSEYKTALDINHGQFCKGEPLSYWTISRNRDEDSMANFTLRSLKISPRWCDGVFAVKYNGYETTDCVFGGCYFNIQKVSDMSVDGMPGF